MPAAARLLAPRLLPATIAVMSLLLMAKAATFARSAAGEPPAVVGANAPLGGPAGLVVPAAPVSGAGVNPAERSLLVELVHRREQLDAREHMLDERAGILQAAQARLQEKMDHLAVLQVRLERLEDERKERDDHSWNGIVKIYEDMKPGDAAAIFDVLDMHVLLQVLDRMNERKAAPVMASMQPERARLATQMLAQMRIRRNAGSMPASAAHRAVSDVVN